MKKFIIPLLFLVILASGIGAFAYLSSTRQLPEQSERTIKPQVVEVVIARPTTEQVAVEALGTVIPAKSVTIFPEVSGRIIRQHRQLVPGGKVKAGQTLVQIDPRDYALACTQQQANVAQAHMQLATEEGMKAAAEKEWQLIKDDVRPTRAGKKLALRELQLETAQSALESAKSALARAELQRERTVIRAPFNGLVVEELVDVGQVVGPSTRIATLVSTDAFWVRVSIPVDQLRWIQIPGLNAQQGSMVTIAQQEPAFGQVKRRGRIKALLGELEPRGKMARLLVEIPDPLGLTRGQRPAGQRSNKSRHSGGLPLLLGTTVSVTIEGPRLDRLYKLPRRALREGHTLWLCSTKNLLEFRSAETIWSTAQHVFVRSPIAGGAAIVVSRLATPIEGMPLTVRSQP